jgi:hypothetical protein
VVERPRVRQEAPVFLHSPSLAPLLLLADGPAVARQLAHTEFQPLIEKAENLIQTGALSFNNERIKTKFQRAFFATH